MPVHALLPEAAGLPPSPGARPAPENPFIALDDPAEWPAFSEPIEAAPLQWESRVAIGGMHCAGCALTIEAALLAVPGVASAYVNGASGRAQVTWSAATVTPSGWMEAVRRAGYSVLPAAEAPAAEERRKEERAALWRLLVAAFCMMQIMMYAWPLYLAQPGDMVAQEAQLLRWASWVLTLPVLLFSCTPFFRQALVDARRLRIGMDLPVALGMAITFAVSSAATFDAGGPLGDQVYFDSLAMFACFLLTARWFEARLAGRTAGALDSLIHRLPDTVLRLRRGAAESDQDDWERISVRRLQVGDRVRVLPGEAFPADGVVLEGSTSVDEALLTGESEPLERTVGAAVIAGSHNLTAPVQVRIERIGADTRFAQIAQLMRQAAVEKPPLARLADRIAQPFIWVVLAAAAVALLYWWPAGAGKALMVATAVLIVTCPCALSLATPAAMLAAAGSLARRGVLVRGLAALEALASIDTIVFDKTGTLTKSGMALRSMSSRDGLDATEALAQAAALARESRHPVARALVAAAAEQAPGAAPDRWRAQSPEEVAGRGMRGLVGLASEPRSARTLLLGSASFCVIQAHSPPPGVMRLHLADEAGWLASFDFAEQLREDAIATLEALHMAGTEIELLSGAQMESVRRLAGKAGIERWRGECSPQDKLDHLKQLQAAGRRVAMVGDGINDGPVLAAAHASFAFGGSVPLAQAQADFVIPGERLEVVAQTLLLARRTMRVVRQNLGWAAAWNAVGIPLAAVGAMPAWLAGLGMAASSLLVVANAARLSSPARLSPRR